MKFKATEKKTLHKNESEGRARCEMILAFLKELLPKIVNLFKSRRRGALASTEGSSEAATGVGVRSA